MNFYEHHIGDYDQATAHLTACEDGIYSRMIRWYYASEAPLPTDIKVIQRRVRAHTRDERAAVQTVLAEFFELREDGYHQHRCDADIERYREKEPEREARRKNDAERQRRARERRKALFDQLRSHDIVPAFDTKTETLERLLSQAESRTANRDESRTVTVPVTRDNTATQSPVPSPQSPEIRKPPSPPKGGKVHEFPPGFEGLWQAYPRKVGKDAAAKAFAKRKPDAALVETMLQAIAAQRQSEQWRKDGGQFIPHLSTWLNDGRWMDETASESSSDIFAGAM